MKKTPKGTIEYMPTMKKKQVLLTIIFFSIAFAILITGIVITGSKKNILTIVAMLGMLPASKSAVEMVMYLKAPEFSKDTYSRISNTAQGIYTLYGLVMTVYEGTFPINAIVIRENSVCAYSEFKNTKKDKLEEHIFNMLKQNGFSGVSVNVLKEEKAFLNRIEQLKRLSENGKEEEIGQLLCDISL